MPTPSEPRRIALALGSGGARGYAHIGVVQEIEARGWEIVGIAGTSMGAVVGGLYATDTLDAYREWVEGLSRRDVLLLMDPTVGGAGIFRAEKIMDRVRRYTGNVNIEDLRMPFTAVATDLLSQREVWFTSGDLVDAMRASIAIPTVFTPVTRDGMVLADGGLLNPVPAVALAGVRADAIIGVNLSGPLTASADAEQHNLSAGTRVPRLHMPSLPSSLEPALVALMPGSKHSREGDATEAVRVAQVSMRTVDVVDRSLAVLQAAVRRYRVAGYPPDVMVDIPADACGTLDFHRASEVIAIGRERAREAFDAWDGTAQLPAID